MLTILAIFLSIPFISPALAAEISDGLIGYWPLDEGSGTTTADMAPAGYHHDGTLVGGAAWTSGYFGSALNFDGVDDYVLCAERDGTEPGTYPQELMPQTFTISCWTKLDTFVYFSSSVGNGMDTGSDECGFFLYNYGWVGDNGQDFGLAIRTETEMSYVETPNIYQTNTWYHLAATYDGTNACVYVNGSLAAGPENVGGPIRWISATSGNYPERFTIGAWLDPGYTLWIDGMIDDVAYWDRALSDAEIATIYTTNEPIIPPPNPALASDPDPDDKETDVPLDVVLKWTPGIYAPPTNGHKVYFSDDRDDVENGAAGANRGLVSDPEFDTADLPFQLAFDTTYFWRIDEANTVTGWDQGPVWRFTTEKFAYPIPTSAITPSASSSSSETAGPDKTIDGSGLDVNDLHSKDTTAMWLSASESPGEAWIQYEFDKTYKLHEMWVWNYNGESLLTLQGLKNVTIEYSTNGIDYTPLGTTHEFAKATGEDGYAHNTVIDFDGAIARYVRITANSNWSGGMVDLYGLSEVRFYYIPMRARRPTPDSGTTDVGPEVTLSWQAGRAAVSHDVYIATSQKALETATSPVATVPHTSYDAGTLDLGQTYYWRIDEVNLADDPPKWKGNIWTFQTPEFITLDDMEAYTPWDVDGDNIFDTWIDGFGNCTTNPGNGSGAVVSLLVGDPANGRNAMKYEYDNDGMVVNPCTGTEQPRPYYSQANATVANLPPAAGSDWTIGGAKILSLSFYGDPNNDSDQTMWVKLTDQIGGSGTVEYGQYADENPATLKEQSWHQWIINLADFGVDLTRVKEMTIGFGRPEATTPGGSGIVYFDDIRLYPSICIPARRKPAGDLNNDCRFDCLDIEILTANWLISTYQVTPQDPGTANLIGHWPLDEGSGIITADQSAYHNDGDLVDGPTWTAGRLGNAISFDGADDYVVCAERTGDAPGTYPAELMPSTFTISCWAKLDTFSYYSGLVGNGIDSGNDECGFFLYNSSGENVPDFGLAIRTETAMSYVETPDIYQTNTWYHLAATYDGTNASLYVDGGLAAGPTDVGGPMRWISATSGNYPERFAIGVWLDPGYELWTDGTIDEVRYYNRALTHAEVGWLAGERDTYTQPLHLFLTPPEPQINAYDGDAIPIIDFKDLAALAADTWLATQLWP